ncbi:unnamed protein product, partial [Symbiodinium necroappetens]
VRIAMQQDKANFSREQITAARGAGPARFAYLLRAITRQGRKFKPPALLPVLRHEGTEHIGAEAITKTLGASYAAAERATPVTPGDFVSSSNDVRSLSDCLDVAASPSVVDLLRGFLDLKKGRAPGLSQIPAEVFAANPIAAALAYAPVILKLIARGIGPLQWSGGLAHSIPKGTKDPSSVQGWRAILLLESDAKAFQKAWRPYLLQALDPVRSVGQHGGIPRHTLEQPSALVRAHFHGLSAANQSGGALFVDCAAAYYSVVRDFYLAGPYHNWTDDELQQRAKLFFADTQSQAAFLKDMRDGLWLESLQLPSALHRIVLAQFHRTWYVDGRPGTTLYLTQTGTAPGSPVADALFAFLFSRFLHGMEEFLRGHLASPHIQVQQAEAAEAPAWADDVVILFTARSVSEVEGLLGEIGRQVIKHLRRLGLSANLGPGKTEAVVALRGHGSRDVRRRLLGADCPALSLTTETEEFPKLRLVPGYTHLGTFLNAELSEMANLKRRAGLLASTFKPIRNRLLNNPFLLPTEKRELLLGRVIPCFLHGSGLWRLSTKHEHEVAVGPLYSAFRQCIRPITGSSSAKMTQAEVLAALDVPSPEELLDVHRVRALFQVLRADMRRVCAGTPVAALVADAEDADLSLLSVRLQDQVNWDDVRLRQQQGEALAVLSSCGPGLAHTCHLCNMAYATHRRLSVHLAKCHGIAGKGPQPWWASLRPI